MNRPFAPQVTVTRDVGPKLDTGDYPILGADRDRVARFRRVATVLAIVASAMLGFVVGALLG